MYFDGSLKLQGAGIDILFIARGGDQLKYALQLLFLASNNVAEYEALIHGLNIVVSLGIKRLMMYVQRRIQRGGKVGHAPLNFAHPFMPNDYLVLSIEKN
jgi:hypothetical protein